MSGDPYWLTTARLGLRRFTPADLDWLTQLYSDTEVTRFLGGPKNRAQAAAMLDTRILQYYAEHPGLGMWVTVDRGNGEAVGFHLLNHIRGESIIQVGFALVKAAWGFGYGTEMGAAILRYGFVELQLPRIAGMAHVDNHASQRVLQKIGLQRNGVRAFPHPDYAAAGAMAWFERERSDWVAERGA
jgi:ribosomal-protein-alanine N-acetyltransferase